MTVDGSPRTRFCKAIQHGSVLNAEAAARELGRLDQVPCDGIGQEALAALLRRRGLRPVKVVVV